jgi:hypothetical protein
MALAADLPDLLFQAAVDKAVILDVGDGLELRGKLLAFDASHVVVARDDGQVVQLERERVLGLSLAQPTAAPTPAQETSPIVAPRAIPSAAAPPGASLNLLREDELFDFRTTDAFRERLQRTPYDATAQQELITLHRTFQEKRQLDLTMNYIGIPFAVISVSCLTAGMIRSNSDIIPGDGTPEYICGLATLVPAFVFVAPNWGSGRAYRALKTEVEEVNVSYARVAPDWWPYVSPALEGGVRAGVAMRF